MIKCIIIGVLSNKIHKRFLFSSYKYKKIKNYLMIEGKSNNFFQNLKKTKNNNNKP